MDWGLIIEVEGSDSNTSGVAGVTRRGDAPTQLVAHGLFWLESFLDRARPFELLSWFDNLSLFDGFGSLDPFRDGFCFLNGPEHFSQPASHFFDEIGHALHRREACCPRTAH